MGKHFHTIDNLLKSSSYREKAREGVDFRCYPSEPRFDLPQSITKTMGASHIMMMNNRQSENFAAETAGRPSSTAISPKASIAQ